jgi:ankyrin repeat protein
MMSMLLRAGADASVRNRRGLTVLMATAAGGHTELLRDILKLGGDVNDVDNEGQTALYYAARGGRAETTRALIDLRSDVDHEARGGETPLMCAAAAGQTESVRVLLRNGARPNVRNRRNKDWTALMYAAAAHGYLTGVVDELLERGAHVNTEDTTGDLPIHIAVREGHSSTVSGLISHGSYVNQKGGYDRKTPLEIAVDRDDRSSAEALLEHSACVTQAAVDQAAKKKSEKMTKLLDKYSGNHCNKP